MHLIKSKLASVVKFGVPVILMTGLLVSCTKERLNTGADQQRTEVTDKVTQKKIQRQADKMPAVGIYNTTMDKVIIFSHDRNGEKNFSFANPPAGGLNFASSNGGEWVYYPDQPEGVYVITEPSAGLGAGGGTVVVGGTSLDIGFAVCFSVGEEALGADLFDTGIDEVAGVIGISGDFEALQEGEFDEGDDDALFSYFHGMAFYLVYAEELANQGYDVLNWLEDLDQPEEELDGFGFAYVVHFVGNGGIYLSSDGELTVDGGSIGFNGTYFGVEGLGFFGGEEENFNYVEVPGFGTMGCN